MAFFAALLFAIPLVNNPVARWWETRVAPCDADEVAAVLVLAGGLARPPESSRPDWSWLSGATAARLAEGIRVQRQRNVPLILTGTEPEVRLMAETAAVRGVPRAQQLHDEGAMTTRANALGIARMTSRPDGLILLVTSAMHMPRAVQTFQRAGIPVCPRPVDYRAWSYVEPAWVFPNVPSLVRADALLHEWVGFFYYRWKGWI